jgi:hypothetical protein
MALNYDLRNVKNFDGIWDENDVMRWDHKDVIFETMHVGINEITEENKEEFILRHKLVCQCHGNDPYISEEAVDNLVGMGTNAKSLTRAKFKADLKRRIGNVVDAKFRLFDERNEDEETKNYEPAERFD